jgi:plasmid stabilization system protein ParE
MKATRWRERSAVTRSEPPEVSGFEDYLIFYLPSDVSIEVTRVLHGARNLQRILGRPKPGSSG